MRHTQRQRQYLGNMSSSLRVWSCSRKGMGCCRHEASPPDVYTSDPTVFSCRCVPCMQPSVCARWPTNPPGQV